MSNPDSNNNINSHNNNRNDDEGQKAQHEPSEPQNPRTAISTEVDPRPVYNRAMEMAAQHFQETNQRLSLRAEGSTNTEQSQAMDQTNQQHQVIRMERENFLVFIKILFKVLDDDPPNRSRAQHIVMECRRRNQGGDPAYVPLMDAVERRLRVLVGEDKWRRSHLLLHHYIQKGRPGLSSTNNNLERHSAIRVGK